MARSTSQRGTIVKTAISAAVVGALLLCASPSLAQDAPGGFLYVVTAEVKPGMTAAYTDFIKKVQDRVHRGA